MGRHVEPQNQLYKKKGPNSRRKLYTHGKICNEAQVALYGSTTVSETFGEGITENVSMMRSGYSWLCAEQKFCEHWPGRDESRPGLQNFKNVREAHPSETETQ